MTANSYSALVSVNPHNRNNMFTRSVHVSCCYKEKENIQHWMGAAGTISSQGCQFKTTQTKLLAERSLEKMLSLHQMTYLYMPYVFTVFCVFALSPLKRNQTSQ